MKEVFGIRAMTAMPFFLKYPGVECNGKEQAHSLLLSQAFKSSENKEMSNKMVFC
jgi:hypothetical protein